jgi:hypothetical protein
MRPKSIMFLRSSSVMLDRKVVLTTMTLLRFGRTCVARMLEPESRHFTPRLPIWSLLCLLLFLGLMVCKSLAMKRPVSAYMFLVREVAQWQACMTFILRAWRIRLQANRVAREINVPYLMYSLECDTKGPEEGHLLLAHST